jgi:hypothetical protein
MRDGSDIEWRHLPAKAQDMSRAAWQELAVATRAGISQAGSWDLFRWLVIALLAANLLLAALLYGKLRSDLAGLQQDRATDELADVRATMAKEIADAKAEITLDISAMSADLQQEVNKTNARLDDLTQSSPRSPTSTTPPKPIAKPGRGR